MAIYCDDVDRHRFLTVLETVVAHRRIECHAYCLMSNHYHLVIRTPEPKPLSGHSYLNGVYAQWWNKRHQRVGHVLAGRFKAQLIQRDGYRTPLGSCEKAWRDRIRRPALACQAVNF